MDGIVTEHPRPDAPRPVVALVAHDRRKDELVEWAQYNRGTLSRCSIFATRTTGMTLQSALATPLRLLLSGPLGGDAQLGSLIAEGRVDAVFFFWDPLTPQPHDVDVKALLRLAVLYDVPIACNRSSADHIISSPLFAEPEKYRQARGQAD
jgi:methylglyoxal synthase